MGGRGGEGGFLLLFLCWACACSIDLWLRSGSHPRLTLRGTSSGLGGFFFFFGGGIVVCVGTPSQTLGPGHTPGLDTLHSLSPLSLSLFSLALSICLPCSLYFFLSLSVSLSLSTFSNFTFSDSLCLSVECHWTGKNGLLDLENFGWCVQWYNLNIGSMKCNLKKIEKCQLEWGCSYNLIYGTLYGRQWHCLFLRSLPVSELNQCPFFLESFVGLNKDLFKNKIRFVCVREFMNVPSLHHLHDPGLQSLGQREPWSCLLGWCIHTVALSWLPQCLALHSKCRWSIWIE